MLQVLTERKVSIRELYPVASPESQGVKIPFGGDEWTVTTLEEGAWRNANAALLSAGATLSRTWVPKLTESGITCIDNSSAFRQDQGVPLVVPEVNPGAIRAGDRLIANPNCSTIQLVMVLYPLHLVFGLEDVIVSTYQSAAGAGQMGIDQLSRQRDGNTSGLDPFGQVLADNLIPGIGPLHESGYFLEEWKLVQESRKIMELPGLQISPTAVRVPIPYCHGESVHLRFKSALDAESARRVLAEAPGIEILDDPENNSYPMPINCVGSDSVFVGRIRQMPGDTHNLDIWTVTDNLRKGAATNAVQILEVMSDQNLFG
jgi:aspartate-semialdehyde dehydrogenase